MKVIPTDYIAPRTINAGQKIRGFIEEKYPDTTNFIENIDGDFNMDGALSETLYSSTINYTLRRLIGVAQFTHRTYEAYGDGRIRIELRKYFQRLTQFSEKDINFLIPLFIECIHNSDDDFNETEKTTAKHQIAKYKWGCFICGRELDMTKNSTSYLAGTADHKWPRALGGESIPENLRYACKDCNTKYKRDFLDYSDFHYEHIVFVIESYSKYLSSSRNRNYEAAIFAKSDFCCVYCNQPAYRVGELFIGRDNLSDSFHFFNLSAYCAAHNPELK